MTLALTLLLACGPDAESVALQLASENPAIREDSARRARNFDSPLVIEGLIKSLDDPSEKVRSHAVDSLIALNAKEAVPRLVLHMSEDSSPLVRRQCIDAVGRLGDPSAVPALIALLEAAEAQTPPAPPLNAIWALGELGDMSALAVLSRLRDSRDPYVAYNANQALRKLRPGT